MQQDSPLACPYTALQGVARGPVSDFSVLAYEPSERELTLPLRQA